LVYNKYLDKNTTKEPNYKTNKKRLLLYYLLKINFFSKKNKKKYVFSNKFIIFGLKFKQQLL